MFASRRREPRRAPSTRSNRRRDRQGAKSALGLHRLRIEPLEERQMLSVFTVNRLDDGPVAHRGDLSGSLRQAIFDANQSSGADSIKFDRRLSGTITLTQGELLITDSVEIDGPGASVLTIAGNPDPDNPARLFTVYGGYSPEPGQMSVTIDGLTLTGGNATSSEWATEGGRSFRSGPI